MDDTITYTGALTVLSCWCGIRHAVPESLRNYQLRKRDDGQSYAIFCPLGHEHVPAATTRIQQLEQALAVEQTRHAQTRARRDEIERQLTATKGVVTRTKNRISKGVCPCCKRHFGNLHRHMTTQHPDYAKIESKD